MSHRVFVTGAAGFIGFHTCTFFKKNHVEVIGFDNFNSYYSPQLKRDRQSVLRQYGVEIMEGDVCDLNLLEHQIQEFKPTHIVHLAAQAGVRYSLAHPHAYLKSNVEGFLNVLEICRNYPSIKLIYASSSSVYGNNVNIPFSIKDRTDQQASFYGVTKKTNELMAKTYGTLFGISNIGLRFFTVYGPWGRPDMAYFSFTKAILEDHPIDFYNHGNMLRDFTYIEDIIEGIYSSLNLTGNQIFNLGSHQPVKLEDFIRILEDCLGKKAKKNYLPMQKGDIETTYADITESRAALGFSPKVSLEQGLPQFVEWYKQYFAV